MITARFTKKDKLITGFSVSGHGTVNSSDFEGKLICSAVSSAVYMATNTITDIIGAKIDYKDDGNAFSVNVLTQKEEAQAILKGLELHFVGLKEEYNNKITIISEV